MTRYLLLLLLVVPCLAQRYFPEGSLSADAERQRRYALWYSEELHAFGEEPLYSEKIDRNAECYRFIWLRSFSHPVVLRIDIAQNGSGRLTIKVGEGSDMPGPGGLRRNESRSLDADSIASFRAKVRAAAFYDLPPFDDAHIGTDGSQWVIEGVCDGRYHVVRRFSPQDGPAMEIGMALIELAIGGDLTPIY